MPKVNAAAHKVHVGSATFQVQRSVGTGTLEIPNLPYDFPCTGHSMPSFKHTLIGIVRIYDADCKNIFTKYDVGVYNLQQPSIITGWWEPTGSKLWNIYSLPDPTAILVLLTDSERSSLQVFRAYNLPSVETLVHCFRSVAGFRVQDTWLYDIKNCN